MLPSGRVGQMHLDMHLEPARPEDRLIEQILAIGHADDHDVVERLHSVDVCQELVYHLVAHLRPHSPVHAPLLAYRVDLVKNYYVKRAAVAQFLLICASLSKQLSNIFLRLSHKFAENLGPVDNLQVFDAESAGQLSGDECLACSWGSIKEDSFDVLNAEPFEGGR